MAQNLVVNFIGNNKLSKTTAAISADLKKFQRTADTVGRSMNKALSFGGVALGFAALTRVLKQSTKAASDDIKSQALLANALKNTIGATGATVAGAEDYIKATQLKVAVLDDELRPALAKAVRATGSLASGEKLLDRALNISAGTGKSLDSVVQALSKAYNGNTTSLKKLIPGLDVTGNYLDDLDKSFAGAAETAANNDPYKKISIIFGELQETIGMTLLPALKEFSAYLSSPEGQRNLQQIANVFKVIGSLIATSTTFLIANFNVIKSLVGALIFVRIAWGTVTAAVRIYTIATQIAKTSTKALKAALITTGVGALVVAVGLLAEGWINANDAQQEYLNPNIGTGDTTVNDWFAKNKDKLISEYSDAWRELGYESYGAYIKAMFDAAQKDKKSKQVIAQLSKTIREAFDKELDRIKSTAEKFRDIIGIAFGVFGEGENSVFNVDVYINKLRRVYEASKGFAENLQKLRKKGADQSFINELIAMGPAQGNVAAKGLLASPGTLTEILGLRGQLYGAGAQAQTQAAITGNATYEININKAVISAAEIIRQIQIFEKKTGRKYLVN